MKLSEPSRWLQRERGVSHGDGDRNTHLTSISHLRHSLVYMYLGELQMVPFYLNKYCLSWYLKKKRERPVPKSRSSSMTWVLRTQPQIPVEVLKASPGPWSGPRVGFPGPADSRASYLLRKDERQRHKYVQILPHVTLKWLMIYSGNRGTCHSACLTYTDLITEDTKTIKDHNCP